MGFDNTASYIQKMLKRSKVPSREEERELVRLAQAGDYKARQKLVESHMRFCLQVTRGFVRYGDAKFNDAFQESLIGINTAIDKFDLSREVKFISYAVWWIRQAVSRFIAEDSLIHVPANLYIKNNMYRKKYKSAIAHGDLPENIPNYPVVISSETRYEDGSYADNNEIVSMIDHESTISELKQKHEMQSMEHVLFKLLSKLEPREYSIVLGYYGLAAGDESRFTLADLADRLGVSKERIRQLLKQSLHVMKNEAIRTNLKHEFDEIVN